LATHDQDRRYGGAPIAIASSDILLAVAVVLPKYIQCVRSQRRGGDRDAPAFGPPIGIVRIRSSGASLTFITAA
jgi:hypothetical protein